MKFVKHVALALILMVGSLAHATRYKLVGQMEKHPDSAPKDLLGGMQDLYYSGEYVCMPGSEHHAPDCRKPEDWVVTDVGTTTITLQDGTTFEVESNGRARKSVFDRVVDKWVTGRLVRNALSQHYDPEYYGAAARGTFRYRVRKVKKVAYEIDIKGIGKGPYPTNNKSVLAAQPNGTQTTP
jgi:hypothetical protein